MWCEVMLELKCKIISIILLYSNLSKKQSDYYENKKIYVALFN